jgi:hypothetical protein
MKPEMSGLTIAVDDGDWGTEPHSFGPYMVERKGGHDWIRIGPEIVNRVAEFMPLQITAGPVSAAVTWPDDVIPRAAAALSGGFLRAADEPEVGEDTPDEDPVAVDDVASTAPETEDEPDRRWVLWLLILVAGLIAFAAYWYFAHSDEPSKPDPDYGEGTAYDPDTAKPALQDRCSLSALTGTHNSFARTHAALKDCGAAVTPEAALALIEGGVVENDPLALTLMGKLYDVGQVADVIEDVVGLGFDHDLTRAVEYYARARDAGSAEAAQLLVVACSDLKTMTSTLAKGTVNDFCR